MTRTPSPHTIEFKTFHNRHVTDIATLHNAIDFFLDTLLKRCTIDYKLNIKVDLKKGPLDSDDSSIVDGYAWEQANGKWFNIQLNGSVPFLELLSTLAHETVHVVQFATGRLKITDEEWLWEGKSYGDMPYKCIEELDNQLPWEYDAYSKDIELARKFVRQYYSTW